MVLVSSVPHTYGMYHMDNFTSICDWYVLTYHFAAAVSCPELNNLNNGIMNCRSKEDEKYFYEDSCSFTCNADYELTGSDTRTCQSDGSWSGSESICKKGWLCYCTYKNSLDVKKSEAN